MDQHAHATAANTSAEPVETLGRIELSVRGALIEVEGIRSTLRALVDKLEAAVDRG